MHSALSVWCFENFRVRMRIFFIFLGLGIYELLKLKYSNRLTFAYLALLIFDYSKNKKRVNFQHSRRLNVVISKFCFLENIYNLINKYKHNLFKLIKFVKICKMFFMSWSKTHWKLQTNKLLKRMLNFYPQFLNI